MTNKTKLIRFLLPLSCILPVICVSSALIIEQFKPSKKSIPNDIPGANWDQFIVQSHNNNVVEPYTDSYGFKEQPYYVNDTYKKQQWIASDQNDPTKSQYDFYVFLADDNGIKYDASPNFNDQGFGGGTWSTPQIMQIWSSSNTASQKIDNTNILWITVINDYTIAVTMNPDGLYNHGGVNTPASESGIYDTSRPETCQLYWNNKSASFFAPPILNWQQKKSMNKDGGTNFVISSNTLSYHYDSSSSDAWILDDKNSTELVIPNGITSIAASSFALNGSSTNMPALSTVIEDTDVTSSYTIGDNAFLNRAVNSVEMQHATSIGAYAFSETSATSAVLDTAIIPNVTSIGTYAFNNQRTLDSFTANSCTSIGAYAFNNCHALNTVSLTGVSSFADSSYIFNATNLHTIYIGNNNGNPIQYNKFLDGTPFVDSSYKGADFRIGIPLANASTDPNSPDWAKSYYNPTFGWTSSYTGAGYPLSQFLYPY